MNTLSGYTELKMGEDTLPFKFGTNCWALFCEMRKIEFSDITTSGAFTGDFVALRDLFYCAYKAAIRSKGEIVKYNVEAFGDLLDETDGAIAQLQDAMLTAKIMGFTFKELTEKGEEAKKK
jgi:hypothetical protein